MKNKSEPAPRDYQQRMRSQTLSWAMGRPYHEPVADECCPDFSCCYRELFITDHAMRWQVYKEYCENNPLNTGESDAG